MVYSQSVNFFIAAIESNKPAVSVSLRIFGRHTVLLAEALGKNSTPKLHHLHQKKLSHLNSFIFFSFKFGSSILMKALSMQEQIYSGWARGNKKQQLTILSLSLSYF